MIRFLCNVKIGQKDPTRMDSSYRGSPQMEYTETVWSFTLTGGDNSDNEDEF